MKIQKEVRKNVFSMASSRCPTAHIHCLPFWTMIAILSYQLFQGSIQPSARVTLQKQKQPDPPLHLYHWNYFWSTSLQTERPGPVNHASNC